MSSARITTTGFEVLEDSGSVGDGVFCWIRDYKGMRHLGSFRVSTVWSLFEDSGLQGDEASWIIQGFYGMESF